MPDGSLSETCRDAFGEVQANPGAKHPGLVRQTFLPPRVPLERRLKPGNETWELVRREHNEPYTLILV